HGVPPITLSFSLIDEPSGLPHLHRRKNSFGLFVPGRTESSKNATVWRARPVIAFTHVVPTSDFHSVVARVLFGPGRRPVRGRLETAAARDPGALLQSHPHRYQLAARQ